MSTLFTTLNQNVEDKMECRSDANDDDDSDECLSPILTNQFNVDDDFNCGKGYLLMTSPSKNKINKAELF